MVRIAIVGLGKMGISHLAIARSHPNVDLVAVCDTSVYVLDVLRKYTGMKTYSDYQKLLDEAALDAVVIATPSQFHGDMVRAALQRNLHVFCEKPFCLDPAEGMELATLARSKGLVNQVGYHCRFVSAFREAKRLLEAGALGRIHHVRAEAYGPVVVRTKNATWRGSKAEGGGCLYDYACHAIDLVTYLIGAPERVCGTVLNSIFSKEVADEAYCTLRFSDGVSGQLACNWSDDSCRKMETRLTIWGSNGRLTVDRQEVQVHLREAPQDDAAQQAGWNRSSTTGLTESPYLLPARRGVQCADRPLCPVHQLRSGGDPVVIRSRGCHRPGDCHDDRRCGTCGAPSCRAFPCHAAHRSARAQEPLRPSLGWTIVKYPKQSETQMDRILFGDNQFFGVNHMSEDTARAQAMRFQSDQSIIDVLDVAYDAGIRVFMCTTHDRIAGIATHIRDNPTRYPDFEFYPCMPYAHKYANAVTEHGMLEALKRFLPDDGKLGALFKGGKSLALKDMEGIAQLLIDAEMKMFAGLRTPVVFLQNLVTDLLLGVGFHEGFRFFADHVMQRYGAQPGFITMNLPRLLDALEGVGIVDPIICANINSLGFRMCGGRELYETTIATRKFRPIAMSVLASGAIPPREAIEYVCQQKNIRSIVFGASSKPHILQTKRLIEELSAAAA